MEIDLVDVIERGIDSEDSPREFYEWAERDFPKFVRKYQPDQMHTSDLGVVLPPDDKKCERKIWLRVNDAEKKSPSLGEKIMFDHGLRIQIRFTYIIKEGLPIGWRIKSFLQEYDSGLESDLVLEYRDNEGWHPYVVEVKTQRGEAFRYLDEPRPSHRLQAMKYMQEEDTEDGCVLYIDREGQNKPKKFTVERNDDEIDQAAERAQYVIERDDEPDKIDNIGVRIRKNKQSDHAVYLSRPFQCEYCDFRGYSCEGVLGGDDLPSGIVGRIDDDGEFYFTEEYDYLPDELAAKLYQTSTYKEKILEDDSDE